VVVVAVAVVAFRCSSVEAVESHPGDKMIEPVSRKIQPGLAVEDGGEGGVAEGMLMGSS
jgi:hypothetical protein